jgi:hypothetical protein
LAPRWCSGKRDRATRNCPPRRRGKVESHPEPRLRDDVTGPGRTGALPLPGRRRRTRPHSRKSRGRQGPPTMHKHLGPFTGRSSPTILNDRCITRKNVLHHCRPQWQSSAEPQPALPAWRLPFAYSQSRLVWSEILTKMHRPDHGQRCPPERPPRLPGARGLMHGYRIRGSFSPRCSAGKWRRGRSRREAERRSVPH